MKVQILNNLKDKKLKMKTIVERIKEPESRIVSDLLDKKNVNFLDIAREIRRGYNEKDAKAIRELYSAVVEWNLRGTNFPRKEIRKLTRENLDWFAQVADKIQEAGYEASGMFLIEPRKEFPGQPLGPITKFYRKVIHYKINVN